MPKVKHAAQVNETVTWPTIHKTRPRLCHTKHLPGTVAAFLWLVPQQTSASTEGNGLTRLSQSPRSQSALSCLFLPLGQDHTHAVAMTSAGIVHMVAKVPLKQWLEGQRMATVV